MLQSTAFMITRLRSNASKTLLPHIRSFSAVQSESSFNKISDDTLHHLVDLLVEVEESIDDSDISLAQGVLKIDLGKLGTWVINKQTPNRQIWWSSPVSGPRRYEFVGSGTEKAVDYPTLWVNTKNNTSIIADLSEEIKIKTKIAILKN